MQKVTINNETFETLSIGTSINGISFTLSGLAIQDAVDKFADETSLSVIEDDTVCGIYKGLAFESATVDKDGNVTVKFHVKDEIEARVDELEQKCTTLEEENAEIKQLQSEQDELLAVLLFGGEE